MVLRSPGCSLFFGGGGVVLLLFLFGTAWFHDRVAVGPDIPGITLLYSAVRDIAVRHRVPDGRNCCLLVESDSIQCFFFLHSNTIYSGVFLMYPLAVLSVAFTVSICLCYILGNYGHIIACTTSPLIISNA